MFFRYKLTIHPDGSQSWEPLSPEDGASLASDQAQTRRRPSRHPDSAYIPIREAADISGFSEYCLKRDCGDGEIVGERYRGRWYVHKGSLMDFLQRISIPCHHERKEETSCG